MTLFSGLSAFPLTPATACGEVMTAALQTQVERLADAGVDSIGLLGSTGIYPYLAPGQRRAAIEMAVLAAGGVPIMAGVGALRTDEACAHAEVAAAAGASGLLLAPISYMPLTDDEVFDHYAAVAATTPLPICVYDNPSTTGFSFSRELILRLMDLPTVKAFKLPLPKAGDFAEELGALRTKRSVSVGYSGDWGCAEALFRGADAWYSVAGGIFPSLASALARAARAGNRLETDRLQQLFEPLWALFRRHGSLRVIYAVACIRGYFYAHPPLPIQPLKREHWSELREAIAPLS